ncbi:MAG: FlgD immunoglobulin-like domain containing protein, partial [Candidatus Krumholzibacteriia bacterium]
NAGGAWHQVASVHPQAMVVHDGQLVVQAAAGADPTLLTPGLAAYDGIVLHDVFTPAGYSTGFATLAPYGEVLMVGGTYTIADGQRIAGSAIRSGNGWFAAGSPDDIGSPRPASLQKLVSVGYEVFAVYQWIDWDIGVDVLAKLVWGTDGFHWQPLEAHESYVGLLQPVGGQLYEIMFDELRTIDPTTGAFTSAVPYSDNGSIHDTCDADGVLTICGTFTVINGQPVGNVAQYVGGAWQGVGDPLPGLRVVAVASLETGQLAAATWSDSRDYNVWIFDGVAWTMLPGGFDGAITRLVYHRGRLFAAGFFERVGPVWAPGVAIWTGERWAAVGSGLRGGVEAVLSVGDKLCFAGRFAWAGGRPSAGYAEWTGDPTLFTGLPSGVPGAPASGRLLEEPRPNPFNPQTEIAFTAPTAGRVTVGIYDVRGRCVRRLVDGLLAAGRHVRRWDGRDDGGRALPSGIYFARLDADGRVESVKLALVR